MLGCVELARQRQRGERAAARVRGVITRWCLTKFTKIENGTLESKIKGEALASHGTARGKRGLRSLSAATATRMNFKGPSLIGGPFRLPGSGPKHPSFCLCCIGPPDHAFELACTAVTALHVEGIGSKEAEKFVRLCCTAGGGDAQALSKSKAKAACKSLRAKASGLPPIEPETLERMQRAVLDIYKPTSTTAASTSSATAADTSAHQEPPTPVD